MMHHHSKALHPACAFLCLEAGGQLAKAVDEMDKERHRPCCHSPVMPVFLPFAVVEL
jgi:hypothetical protein